MFPNMLFELKVVLKMLIYHQTIKQVKYLFTVLKPRSESVKGQMWSKGPCMVPCCMQALLTHALKIS